ncbi:amidohydrolase [Colletotrichum sojae]|uniref:Amidohydrolase n=1 Tax=Colletotrichum sojae TaxID=2175907 RepID=A0A8H6JY75_9PEZI|nr:amidohydrolase [Colletotrichum sojae]
MRVPFRPSRSDAALTAAQPNTQPATTQVNNMPSSAVADSNINVIVAEVLIPGRGDPLKNAAVVVKDGKIAYVGPRNELPEEYRSANCVHVPVVMPGLWDVHVHYMGVDAVSSLNGLYSFLPGGNALIGAVTVDDLERTLMSGYTSVRELGGYAGDLVPAIEKGRLIGPNVYTAIAAMSITGGHGDIHQVPIDTVLRFEACGGPCSIADGPEDCLKQVRLLVRRGARCIKVCSSGGVLSLLDDPEDRQFSDEELKAIVDEAARTRRSVAAHAIGKAGILAALRAGVKSIEHGMYLDDEVADMMLEKDAIFVATQHIVTTIGKDTSQLAPEQARKVEKLLDKAATSYQLAIKRGLKIALGTDTLSSDSTKELAHGNNARELYWAVKHGMTPLQAIEAGTANAPEVLGKMAPLSGQLKVGYDADLIAVAKNPLDDIEILSKKENITHVWKGGKLYKSP